MPRVEAKRYLPHVIVLATVLGTYGFLSLPRTMRGDPEGPIPLTLPDRLGPYIGEDLFFCQSDQCGRALRAAELADEPDGTRLCPSCTNEVSSISIGERKELPKGTPIFRKVYSAPDRTDIQTTIVFSGTERRSIHKPQVCLVSQGHRIINEYDYDIAATPDHRMPVRVIEVMQEYTGTHGKKTLQQSIYAYWFFSPERETSSHFRRTLWMAYDNAVRNYRPRWAYVSLALLVDPARPNAFRAVLDDFVPRLYPLTEALRAEFRRLDGLEVPASR